MSRTVTIQISEKLYQRIQKEHSLEFAPYYRDCSFEEYICKTLQSYYDRYDMQREMEKCRADDDA